MEENFEEFRQLYSKVMDHEFKDIIRISDGKFELIGDETYARLRLMNYLNDNLF